MGQKCLCSGPTLPSAGPGGSALLCRCGHEGAERGQDFTAAAWAESGTAKTKFAPLPPCVAEPGPGEGAHSWAQADQGQHPNAATH